MPPVLENDCWEEQIILAYIHQLVIKAVSRVRPPLKVIASSRFPLDRERRASIGKNLGFGNRGGGFLNRVLRAGTGILKFTRGLGSLRRGHEAGIGTVRLAPEKHPKGASSLPLPVALAGEIILRGARSRHREHGRGAGAGNHADGNATAPADRRQAQVSCSSPTLNQAGYARCSSAK